MHATHALSRLDSTWLRMEQPTNPMVVTVLLELDGRAPPARLEDLIRTRLLVHERFRSLVVDGKWPAWQVDEQFALSAHVHHVGVPSPGGDEGLRQLLDDLVSAPLDPRRPLWQIHIVDTGKHTTLIVRVHHCLADGIALVRLLLELSDHPPALPAPEVGPQPIESGRRHRLRELAAAGQAALRDLFLPADPSGPLRGRLCGRKRVAWSAPSDLRAGLAAAHRIGGTVTEVYAAALSGALREYLAEVDPGAPVDELHALVPVNLRGLGGGGPLGNRFGLVYLQLPLHAASPAERLSLVHERLEHIKHSGEAVASMAVLGLMGLAGQRAEQLGIASFTRKASLIVTSVPGPASPVFLADLPVKNLAVFSPASGDLGLTCCLVSYDGQTRLGITADEAVIPDPQVLLAAYEDELRQLLA